MTPRERVLKALEHKEPDKVPIDLGGTLASTLTGTANQKLKDFLGIKKDGEPRTFALADCIYPLEEVFKLFEVDFRTVRMKSPDQKGSGNKGFTSTDLLNTPQGHQFIDEYGTVWQKAQYDYAPVKFAFSNKDVSDFESFTWPDPYDKGRVRGLRKEAEELRKNTDYAIILDIMCGGPYENSLWVRGFDKFLEDLMIDKKFATALLDKITEIDMGFWDAQLTEVGNLVDVVCQGEDMGMQLGMQFSPDIYRKMIKPFHKRLFSFIRSKTNAKIWLHSCGSIVPIIPDLIEIGIDIINPVQTNARDMGLAGLKKEFGKDITFWGGGIDVQNIPFLSIDEIRERVKRNIEIMSPGGGYVFSATHNILPETDGEKTYTAYITAVQQRDYISIKD